MTRDNLESMFSCTRDISVTKFIGDIYVNAGDISFWIFKDVIDMF